MSKVWFYSSLNPKNWDTRKVVAGVLATAIVGLSGLTIANIGSRMHDERNIKANVFELDNKRSSLGVTIATKCGLDNFTPSSIETYFNENDGYVLNILGTTDNGTSADVMKNIVFQIGEDSYNYLIDAIRNKTKEDKRIDSIISEHGTYTFTKPKNEAKAFSKKSLEESKSLTDRLYTVVQHIVERTPSKNVLNLDDD